MCGKLVYERDWLPGLNKCLPCLKLVQLVRANMGRKALCLYLVFRDTDDLSKAMNHRIYPEYK